MLDEEIDKKIFVLKNQYDAQPLNILKGYWVDTFDYMVEMFYGKVLKNLSNVKKTIRVFMV